MQPPCCVGFSRTKIPLLALSPAAYGSVMKTTAILVEGRLLRRLEETKPREQSLSAYVRSLLERALLQDALSVSTAPIATSRCTGYRP